jgi:2-(1,2-epoxy-1,2-dihydrophenyl)acetyl-CoA isomerase
LDRRPGTRGQWQGGAWQPDAMVDLAVETVGHVRVVRLDRPERKNALTSSLGWSVVGAIGDADADDSVRVVALTGNGDAFCSGLDLGGGDDALVETGLSDQQQILDEKGWVGRFLLALRFETDKPVVAGINGAAVGAGLSLAMAADIRIAADTARLHPGYLRAGTSPDGGLTWSLPSLVGHENAMRFLLESRFVDADEARRRGLVSEVVAADRLEERLMELCEAVAAQAPLAVQRTKRLVARTPLITDVEARMIDEIRNARAGLDSEDGQEAVRAILEKRSPTFRGC